MYMESKRSKYILIALTALCVLLISITSLKDGIMEPLRNGVGYFLIPIQSGVNKVGTGIYNELTNYGRLHEALRENEELSQEIARLTEENNRLQAEQFELERLRELYQLDQEYMQYEKIGARVIARDSEKWFQVFRINKGSADGIAVDMNVVAGGGLVGIVTEVGSNWATVRAIIDDSSNVSAMTVSTDDNCVVEGDLELIDEGKLRFTQLYDLEDRVTVGERIVTSNISEKYVEGLFIGYVSDIELDTNNLTKTGTIVTPVDFQHLKDVFVITVNKQDSIQGDAAGGNTETEDDETQEGAE